MSLCEKSAFRKISKMTNIEDGDTTVTHDRNPRMAALLAVHLVSQVLDEAYDIANAARDSGHPWQYLSLLKSFKSSRSDNMVDGNLTFEVSKGDCDEHENKMETMTNVATSTPQKVTKVACSDQGEGLISHDTNLIGQGDEDLEMQHNELGTSTLINRLFDMSEVERDIAPEQTNSISKITPKPDDNYLISKAMQQIFGVCMAHHNFNSYNIVHLDSMVLPDVTLPNEKEEQKESPRTDNSNYSFLSDAADINRDVAFYIDDDTPYLKHDDIGDMKNDGEGDQSIMDEEPTERVDSIQTQELDTQEIQKNVALYEDAYATLNRDYDQGSEDGFPILQDPKGMVMQEVELMTASTSDDDNIVSYPITEHTERETKSVKEIPTPLMAPINYKRNSLAKKCRLQGSRLLSCFRGMWRRGPDTSEDFRCTDVPVRCSLSPEARRRASSLVDYNTTRRSPSPLPWKYRTINEIMLHSGQLKEYARVGIMQTSKIKTRFLYSKANFN